MAKDKTKNGVPNKHLHARISYLQQASTLLAVGQATSQVSAKTTAPGLKKEYADQGLQTAAKPTPLASAPEEPNRNTSRAKNESEDPGVLNFQPPSFGGLPLQLSSHLAQVARKSQIRLHPSIKHALCKRCSTPLIEGQTCMKHMGNLSKGGRKPHADVLVVECTCCGAAKRWPVGAKRQQRKTERKKDSRDLNGVATEPNSKQGGG